MKGTKTVQVDGKEITLRFDLGAIEDFCEDLDIGFSEWEKEVFDKPKSLRKFIYYMAKSGGSDIEADELRKMTVTELSDIAEIIGESAVGKAKAKQGK